MYSKQQILSVALIALTLIGLVKSDMYLRLEMESFRNPRGLKNDSQLCANSARCATFFKFCLKTSAHTHDCISEFKTQVIGENTISSEQFRLTTSSIEFPIATSNIKDLYLTIEAQNEINSLSQQKSELISEWTLENILTNSRVNTWTKYKGVNQELGQQIAFNYKTECFGDYGGELCQTRNSVEAKCTLACKNGGKCELNHANNVQTCKCDAEMYKGDLCQIKIILHSCSANSACLNGGSCLANGECLCPPGYAGERCQTKRLTSQCGMVTCYNGGTCFIDNQNEYACMCHPAFTGPRCDTKIITTTTTTKPTITTTITTKTTSTVAMATDSDNHVVQRPGFSVQEILLIVLAGVGMPIFTILIILMLCRLNSNRKFDEQLKDSQIEAPNKQVFKSAVENIYVECNGKSQATKHFVLTVSETSKSVTKSQLCYSDDNIYSSIDFANEKPSVKPAYEFSSKTRQLYLHDDFQATIV